MSVSPDAQRKGVGTMFYEARKQYVREHHLKRILTGGRIPGYDQVSHEMTPAKYVNQVVARKKKDPTLSFQLKNGFVVLNVIPDYLEDTESHGCATLLEWLNPEYMASVSLKAAVHNTPETKTEEDNQEPLNTHPNNVRIAAIQYKLRPIVDFNGFASQVEFFVQSAKAYGAHFVLFPELFTMQLLGYMHEPAPAIAVRRLAQLTSEYESLFKRLAQETGQYLIAGSHPVILEGELFNAAHLFAPNGRIHRQKKVHLTPTEKGPFQMGRGHGFNVFHTEFGRIAILICYDIEFHEAARVLAEAGTEILFVPSCTDDRQGFLRVRYCAQARAIENQIYVVLTGTVGNLPGVPYMNNNYGQAAIFTPADYFFARDGIAAEGSINQDQMILADVNLQLLNEQRTSGTVIPLNDLIQDAYDQVTHHKLEPELWNLVKT